MQVRSSVSSADVFGGTLPLGQKQQRHEKQLCGSAVTLLLSVWALVRPGGFGRHVLVGLSPALTVFFITWHLAAYLSTALSAYVTIPDLLQSIGVYAFDTPPPVFLPLATQAVMVIILSGLTRSRLPRCRLQSALHDTRLRRSSRDCRAGRPHALFFGC